MIIKNKKNFVLKGGKVILVSAIILVLTFIMLIPFITMISTALKETKELLAVPQTMIPRHPTLENFSTSWQAAPFGRYYINSLFVSSVLTASCLFFSSLTGYAFSKFRFRGHKLMFFLILGTMMVPFQVVMIPLYVMMAKIGWADTYQGLIVPSMITSFGVFLMRQYIGSIPGELIDAARIDGCGELHIYWGIILPNIKPALAALAIYTFTVTWDEFLWPFIIISSTNLRTIPLGLAMFESRVEMMQMLTWNILIAASLIAMLPVLVAFLFLQKYFVRGMTFTGLKG